MDNTQTAPATLEAVVGDLVDPALGGEQFAGEEITEGFPIEKAIVEEIEEDGTLVVRHEHDGRDLELDEAEKVIKHARRLWGNNVKLFTELEEELWEI